VGCLLINSGLWPSVPIKVGNATLVLSEFVYVQPPPKNKYHNNGTLQIVARTGLITNKKPP
jgi:hypothetical protein